MADTSHPHFVFTENTIGLPDHLYIDENGKPQSGLLARYVGATGRRKRRFAEKKMQRKGIPPKVFITNKNHVLVDYCAGSQFRCVTFHFLMESYMKAVQKDNFDYETWANEFAARSIEIGIFDTYARDIFLTKYVSDEEDGNKKFVNSRLSQVFDRFDQRMEDWEKMTNTERRHMAELAFSLGTVYSVDVMNTALKEKEGFSGYFSQMMALPFNLSGDTDAAQDSSEEFSVDMGSEEDFYQAISEQVVLGQNDSGIPLYAARITSLAKALVKWQEENVISVDINAILAMLSKALMDLGANIDLPLCVDGDEEICCMLQNTWNEYFCSECAQSLSADDVTSLLADKYQAIDSLKVDLEAIKVRRGSAQSALEDIKNSAPTSALEKNRSRKTQNALHTKLLDLEGKELTLQEQATELLLPPEFTLDVFEGEGPHELLIGDRKSISLSDQVRMNAVIEFLDRADSDVTAEPPEHSGDAENTVIDEEKKTQLSEVEDTEDLEESIIDDKAEVTAVDVQEEEEQPESESEEEPEEEGIEEPGVVAPVFDEDTQAEEPVKDELEEEPEGEKPETESIKDIKLGETQPPQQKPPSNLCELAIACRQEAEKGFITGATINAIVAKYIEKNQIETAFSFLKVIERLDITGEHFDRTLLKSAFYGMNTWDYGHTHSKSQRLLATISHEMIDSWSDMPEGAIVPYLMLTAVFQPAMFGGGYSTAPHLLRYIAQCFDGQLRHLVDATVELASRNQLVSIEALRPEGSDNRELKFDPQEKLDPWVQKIRNAHRGYGPLIRAQNYCLDHGIFSTIVSILRSNDRAHTDTVESFITSMESQEASDSLLEKEMSDSGLDIGLSEIFTQAKRGFHHKVGELIDVAKDWLAVGKSMQGNEIETFSRKFPTRLDSAIEEIGTLYRDSGMNSDRRAGTGLALRMLKQIKTVLDGNEISAWEYDRTKAWFNHPDLLMRQAGIGGSAREELDWHLSELSQTMDHRGHFEGALVANDPTLAELMRMHLIESGGESDTDSGRVDDCFSASRRGMISQARRMLSQVENAKLSSLISDSEADMLEAELDDVLEKFENLIVMSDIRTLRERLEEIERDIASKTASKKSALEKQYRAGLDKLRVVVTGNPVPDRWIEDMEQALRDDNLPVVSEMIDELNTAIKTVRPIRFSKIQSLSVLPDFLLVEGKILPELAMCTQQREIWHKVVNEENAFGLDFTYKSPSLKKVVEAIVDWTQVTKPQSDIDKGLFDNALTIMNFLGLQALEKGYRGALKNTSDYKVAPGISAFNVKLGNSHSPRPFPVFGESGASHLTIIVAFKDWQPEKIYDLLSSAAYTSSVPLLISAKPLTLEKRNAFALYFKHKQKRVLHLDMAMALFLGSQPDCGADSTALKNFLWLSTPFTYYNPYVGGDTGNPPPREMRYGRAIEIDQLLTMGGAAIVFGGRQLGKSTILQEVRSRFHQPRLRNYAFYRQLDRNMDRLALSKSDWDHAEYMVWGDIYDELHKSRLIDKPKTSLKSKEMQESVRSSLIKHKDASVIMIFDEIDPVLNVDNAHDFMMFRALREVVNDPDIKGRFKVIIAGLENVTRFESSPNYPLPQLGGSIQVTIMATQDAIHLIREPLRSLGYTFENAQVVNRILAITNRHPGLIQIFCHELIKSLAANHRGRIGNQVIADDDITGVYQLPIVLELIRSRFDMTLNLDLRYLVIIYGLVNEGKGARPFAPREAKEIAEAWLPDEFTKLSEKQFEAFLIEMVGLGVLRTEKQGMSNQYALRNTNVLKLLGSDGGADVAHKLERALNDYRSSDPLDRHAYFEDENVSSPITFRDEKEILGTVIKEQADAELGRQDTRFYTTSIIVGSSAQGADELENTLPYIYEADIAGQKNLKKKSQYELIAKLDSEFDSPKQFGERIRGLLVSRVKDSPIMILVTVTGEQPLANFLAMIDAAHEHSNFDMKDRYPFRVIFKMTPRAYYHWLSSPELTRDREGIQPFIKLGPWSSGALRYLLDKIGMQNSSAEVETLERYSEGWFLSLDILSKLKKNRKSASELRELKSAYKPLTDIPVKEARKFAESAGVNQFWWVSSFIEAIRTSGDEDYTVDDLYILAEDSAVIDEHDDIDVVEKMALWMADMNILKRIRKPNSRENYFRLMPSISHIIQVLESE